MEIINWNAHTLRANFKPDGRQSGMLTGTIDIIVEVGDIKRVKGDCINGVSGCEFKVDEVIESRPAKGNYFQRPTFQRLLVKYVC